MEIKNIYTLEGEVTVLVKHEHPSQVDRVEFMATEEDGLEKLKEKARMFVKIWRDVYFSDEGKQMQMRFTIYRNVIVNNMILKDEPVFKNELKNY